MSRPRKTRIAVVFGGRSTEHAISAVSAGSILAALDPDEYEVLPVGITREGRWVLTSADPQSLSIQGSRLPEVTGGAGAEVVLGSSGALVVLDPAAGAAALDGVDVVFPALHGVFGEDGTIQGLLEMAGIPYVGSNVFASAAAMDKEFTKKLATVAGIPVTPYAVLRAGETLTDTDRDRLGLPLFVKPARAGSSFGVSKVKSYDELEAAIAAARVHDPKVLVESAVIGREIECGVIEGEAGGAPEASLLAEVRVVRDHEFYDFEAKYLEDSCEFDIPAGLPERVTRLVQEYACRTFVALDCAGLARVDFFVTGDFEVYLNEINTMPGFTSTSMFPRMWAASGLEYPKLVDRLVRTALRRGTGLH